MSLIDVAREATNQFKAQSNLLFPDFSYFELKGIKDDDDQHPSDWVDTLTSYIFVYSFFRFH